MRRLALVLASAAFVVACVDLFHGTDFTTLCTGDEDACAPVVDATADVPLQEVPLLDFCAWDSAEARARAEHTCAWLGACEGAAAGSTYGLCMTRALEAYDCRYNPGLRPAGVTHALWSCLAALPTVTSCADVSRCLHGPTPPTCAAVASGGGTFTACAPTGETVLSCALPGQSSPPVASESCTLEGRRCSDAGTATCVGVKRTSCGNNDTCDGTNAVRCRTENTSNDVGLDCALRGGGACVASDAGVACTPIADAGACDAGAAVRCDDAGAAHSCVGGRDVVVDCTAVGRACTASPHPLDPAAACTAAGTCSDDPARPTETCTDGVIASCSRGELFTLDCARAGLVDGCEVPAPPYIGRARCRKP